MWVIIKALGYFIQVLEYMIIIRVIMSWFRTNKYYRLQEFIYNATEPILGPARDLMSRFINTGPVDLSPILALFLIRMIYNLVVRILVGVGF